MFIRNHYTPRLEDNAQEFDMPSLVIPDLSYSVQQLAHDYAIGQLPPMSRFMYDDLDEDDEIRLTNELETDNYSDVRYTDKLDAMMQFSDSQIKLKSVKERIKAMRDYKLRQNLVKPEQEPITALE